MPNLTVKNLPNDLYVLLKARAAEHRRSINSEVQWCLERVLRSRRVEPEALLARADAVRERLRMPAWTPERLRDAKSTGRP